MMCPPTLSRLMLLAEAIHISIKVRLLANLGGIANEMTGDHRSRLEQDMNNQFGMVAIAIAIVDHAD